MKQWQLSSQKKKNYLLTADLSPLDLDKIMGDASKSVNKIIGSRDGGSLKVAVGAVLYPSDVEELRKKFLSLPESFFEE